MNYKHGHAAAQGSLTYSSWCAMKSRARRLPGYIERGMCPRWEVFENFLADMGERPAGRSIERTDNTKGYEPGNCVWGTRKDQSRNRSGRRVVMFQGEEMILAEAIVRSGIPVERFEQRVYNRGWTVERALTTPVRRRA
jgi:hypothetical protein